MGKVRLQQVEGRNVVSQLSTAHAEKQKVTREWLKFVSRVLRFCASQEIASREHRFDGDKTGNFIGAVGLVLQHSQEFRDIQSKIPLNAQYLSPEPQNDLLHCMAGMVQSHIVNKVKQAKFWSIIAD